MKHRKRKHVGNSFRQVGPWHYPSLIRYVGAIMRNMDAEEDKDLA